MTCSYCRHFNLRAYFSVPSLVPDWAPESYNPPNHLVIERVVAYGPDERDEISEGFVKAGAAYVLSEPA